MCVCVATGERLTFTFVLALSDRRFLSWRIWRAARIAEA
jgi:hypothetical protein